jgi:carbon monoxide dehydrogenase subunit G
VPGATLLEELGSNCYRGQASVKLGPVQVHFNGEAALVEADDARHRATVRARGTDRSGRGGAAANICFQLSGTDSTSHVRVVTDLQLNGAIAQYGRAQGVLDAVAREIVKQFAENLRSTLITRNSVHSIEAPEILSSGEKILTGNSPSPANTLSLFSLLTAVVKSFFRRRPIA